MKLKLLILLIPILLPLISPAPTLAICSPPAPYGRGVSCIPTKHNVACFKPGGGMIPVACCDSAGDCPPGSSNSVPTPLPPPGADKVWCSGVPGSGIKTALGCIKTFGTGSSEIKNVIGQILTWAVGIGGVIAFLVLVYAGAMIVMAGGDPKKVKAGQELVGAALGGLVLIILGVVILNFLGVRILGLSNLGFKTP